MCRIFSLVLWVLLLPLLVISCASENIFDAIGSSVVDPIAVVVDSTNGFAYVVNSNVHVSKNWTQGSVHVLDISDPSKPILKENISGISSFSGQAYLDSASGYLYVTNRLSSSNFDEADTLYRISVDVSAGKSGKVESFDTMKNPFGLACCDDEGNLFIATSNSAVQYFSLSTSPSSIGSIDLKVKLSDGSSLLNGDVSRLTITGNWLFAGRIYGGVYVIDAGELQVSGANPVDYIISDISSPRGMASTDQHLYVVDVDSSDNYGYLRIIDVQKFEPLGSNTTTMLLDKEDDSLLVGSVRVGDDPQEIVLGKEYAFVSNMGSDTVSFIDLASNSRVVDVAVGDEPFGMALYTPNDTSAYLVVCNLGADTVSIIDVSSKKVIATYP